MWESAISSIESSEIFTSLVDNITLEMALKFFVVYFIIVWIAILVWVVKDITNRTDNILLQLISILIIFFLTPFWIFIYLLIRPSKTIFEKYYEEIEDNLDLFSSIIKEKTIWDDEKIHCFNCKEPVWPDFKYCPHCKEKLKSECKSCKKNLYIWRRICPYCWDKQKSTKPEKKKK